ncbi:hypothetical protein MUK42_35742, partial [Musa troglodytarum]
TSDSSLPSRAPLNRLSTASYPSTLRSRLSPSRSLFFCVSIYLSIYLSISVSLFSSCFCGGSSSPSRSWQKAAPFPEISGIGGRNERKRLPGRGGGGARRVRSRDSIHGAHVMTKGESFH